MKGKSRMHLKLGFFPLKPANCQLLLPAAAAVYHPASSRATQMENWLGWLMTKVSPKLAFVICGKGTELPLEPDCRAGDRQFPTTTPGHPLPPPSSQNLGLSPAFICKDPPKALGKLPMLLGWINIFIHHQPDCNIWILTVTPPN